MSRGPPVLFALGASARFGSAVASALGVPLAAHEEREFVGGEHKARPLVSVRDRDVYVIHTLNGQAHASPNDKLVRLLFFIGAARDAGAARVTAVVPYLAYSRKDQKSKPRDPVTTRYVAALLEAVGADCVVTIDVHNLAAFQNAFRIRSENLEAAGVFVERCIVLAGDAPLVVVSPDAGGIKRADRFRARLAKRLGHPVGVAFAEKYRSEGVLRGEALVGEVDGQVAVVVDDLVSVGHTLDRAARACRAHGATRVLAAVTHGLFAGDAPNVLAASPLDAILVTDTVDAPPFANAALAARVQRVSIANLVGEAIGRLNAGGSVVELSD